MLGAARRGDVYAGFELELGLERSGTASGKHLMIQRQLLTVLKWRLRR